MGIFKQLGALVGRSKLLGAPRSREQILTNQSEAFVEMEKHNPAPKINLSPDALTDAEIDAKLAELEKSSKLGDDYVQLLDQIQITKPLELEQIDYAQRNRPENRPTDPGLESEKQFHKTGQVPRGKCRPNDLVDVVTNHRMAPGEWNAVAIAEHLKLREEDVKHYLTHFELIDEHAKFLNPDENFTEFKITQDEWEKDSDKLEKS